MSHEVVSILENNWEVIRQECEKVAAPSYTQWPEHGIYRGQWDVYGIYDLQGNLIPAHAQECPETTKILEKIPRLRTGGFSMLGAGAQIKPHVGYTDAVLRAHLGLIIPEGDCGLKVGDHTYRWTEGNAFVFDDRELHEAWNNTSGSRYILLVDYFK